MTLDQAVKSKEYEVVEIQGGWNARQRLNQMGIHVGDKVKVKRGGILGGPLLVQVHGLEVALGRGLSEKIKVK